MLKRYIGDRAFYRMVLMVAVPIMVQNAITNFVSLLDNIMIGQVGTVQMTGVAIANQLIFVFNLCIFGAISGAGIFGAQFYGKQDMEGVRHTFRFKLLICIGITVLAILLFISAGDQLIGVYLKGEGALEDAAASLRYGREYLMISLVGMVPFAVVQAYSGTLRETGETVLPMKASLVAVLVNLVLNYILIFGHFGFPQLGAAGAAIATVISRFVECFIVIRWTHRNVELFPYVVGLYSSFFVPGNLVKQIIRKGTPLLVNESLWATGIAVLNQCYSIRSLDVVAAVNITSTVWNVFSCVYLAMGSAIGILVGRELGAGRFENAKDTARKMIVFSCGSAILVGGLLAAVSGLYPMLYNTTPFIRGLATSFIRVTAILMPAYSLTNAFYFTLRAGGKTGVTFLFDSCYVWCISIPTAYILSRYTAMPIVSLYFCCQGLEIFKSIIGYIMVKKGLWIHNIVSDDSV